MTLRSQSEHATTASPPENFVTVTNHFLEFGIN